MNIRVCHPFGNPFSYNAAVGLLERGRLERFHTLLYEPFGWGKRRHPELPRRYVATHPAREVLRLGAARLPLGQWNGRRQQVVDWVARSFDRMTAKAVRETDRAVYCYEDSAEQTFRRAGDMGVGRIYELPILYHREVERLFNLELNRRPELEPFLTSLREPASKRAQKDRELKTADVIVTPARFVQRSIERYLQPQASFLTAPYGCDSRTPSKIWRPEEQGGPLRVLFAGILGPRKGVHLLFEALTKMAGRHVQLTLAGRWQPGFREWLAKKYPIPYEWLGQLSHPKVYEACRRSHLFVFPSLAEGFGLVLLEAMASGIPVITTDQTAGPELMQEGAEGWVIPAGDVEALELSLEGALKQRRHLAEMGHAARRTAEARSWNRYRTELSEQLNKVMSRRKETGAV